MWAVPLGRGQPCEGPRPPAVSGPCEGDCSPFSTPAALHAHPIFLPRVLSYHAGRKDPSVGFGSGQVRSHRGACGAGTSLILGVEVFQPVASVALRSGSGEGRAWLDPCLWNPQSSHLWGAATLSWVGAPLTYSTGPRESFLVSGPDKAAEQESAVCDGSTFSLAESLLWGVTLATCKPLTLAAGEKTVTLGRRSPSPH